MSKNDKVKKLCNAIRRYKGRYNPTDIRKDGTILWSTPPDKNALVDVQRWLERLKLNVAEITVKINNIKTVSEFEQLIKEL